MNLKEQLKAKQAELLALKDKIEAGDTEAITKAGEIADAITELENSIAAAEKSMTILKSMGTPEGEEVADDLKSAKAGLKSLQVQAKSVDRSKKGWSISANFKAATDTITSVQIADIDRDVIPQPRVNRFADLLSQARLSGNAVTYFQEGAWEQNPAAPAPWMVAEGAKKPQAHTSFTPKTEPLQKIAGFVKETDEVLDDNDFLASAVDDALVYRLAKAENAYVLAKIIDGTEGLGSVTYTPVSGDASATSVAIAEAILKAKTEIDANTPYRATVAVMNPTDYFNLIVAKDHNGQYYGGGYFTGAYGNGGYAGTYGPWGLQIFVDSGVANGEVLVLAREAVKFYRKNDATVRVFEQNEDDALYNRVTVLAEERVLAAVKAPAAVYLITAQN